MDMGLQRIATRLQLKKPETRNAAEKDLEASPPILESSDEIRVQFEDNIQKFHDHRKLALSEWKRATYLNEAEVGGLENFGDSLLRGASRAMYIVLYLERLAGDAATAIHDTTQFAQSKIDDGTMSRGQLIYPEARRIAKWVRSIIHQGEPVFSTSDRSDLYEGQVAGQGKNPEHLRPSNVWERYSDYLRIVPALFRSQESVFGFRVALATLSGTIMAFLRQTHNFYYDQRIIWTIIVIIVGWHMTAGQSVFALVGRACAALVGMTLCFIIYYVSGGKFA